VNSAKHLPDLVFIHGWGLNASVWDTTRHEIQNKHHAHFLDLPGYGGSDRLPTRYSLDNLAKWVMENVPVGSVWIGWSLGGMIALRAAMMLPEYISKLVLIATTPKFSNSEDWTFGVNPESVHMFSQMLEQDYRAMLTTFFLIQAASATTARKPLREFVSRVAQAGTPSPQVLKDSLDVLIETDLRGDLDVLRLPVHLIYGTEDKLIPLTAAEYLSQRLANARLHTIVGAGHNLFMTHHREFNQVLESCLNG